MCSTSLERLITCNRKFIPRRLIFREASTTLPELPSRGRWGVMLCCPAAQGCRRKASNPFLWMLFPSRYSHQLENAEKRGWRFTLHFFFLTRLESAQAYFIFHHHTYRHLPQYPFICLLSYFSHEDTYSVWVFFVASRMELDTWQKSMNNCWIHVVFLDKWIK